MIEALIACRSCGAVARCATFTGEPDCAKCIRANGHDHEDVELGACEICHFIGADQTTPGHVTDWLCDQGCDAVEGPGIKGGNLRVRYVIGWSELLVYRTGSVMVATFIDGQSRAVAQDIIDDPSELLHVLNVHADAASAAEEVYA